MTVAPNNDVVGMLVVVEVAPGDESTRTSLWPDLGSAPVFAMGSLLVSVAILVVGVTAVAIRSFPPGGTSRCRRRDGSRWWWSKRGGGGGGQRKGKKTRQLKKGPPIILR
jgi:hypothetical protein